MKKFKNCKKGDKIYIYDFTEIKNGFQEFNIIDVKYTPQKEDYCGCGCSTIPEHWDIHFESPYLDRHITVQNYVKDYIIYTGTYAMNDHGKTVVKNIQLGLFTQLDNAKYKIFEYYSNKIGDFKKTIKNLDSQIEILENKKMQCDLAISDISNALIEFENVINEEV